MKTQDIARRVSEYPLKKIHAEKPRKDKIMLSYHDITALTVGGEGPFAFSSIKEALEYVQGLRCIGVRQPIAIRLTEDVYTLNEPIRIDNSITDVTIEPEGTGRAAILGGTEITGFAWDTYNGVKCLSAPLPEACQTEDGGADFSDLYVNGERASYTRYPAEGYLYPEAVENEEGKLGSSSGWFIAEEGDIRDFRHMERIQLSFCHYWVDEHTPIASYDPATRRVTMKYRSAYNITGGKGTSSGLEYYLENVAEMFANPNEWYADEGKLYYIPRDASVTPETIHAYIPLLYKLVDVRGTAEQKVRNIHFRNIDFAVTRGEFVTMRQGSDGPVGYACGGQSVAGADGAVSFLYAANCSVENCTLKNYGLHGIVIGGGCHHIRVEGCDMYDGGAGGVKINGGIAGTPENEHTHDNVVNNCTILHCGRRYFAACGILSMHSYNNTFSHNEIGYMYYTGISVGWIWGYAESITRDNRITKNYIHHIGQGKLSDLAGVYLLGSQQGTVVSNNIIHDVKAKVYGGSALYTDEGSSFTILENNICYNTSDNVYQQHYGMMNTVRNNIFAFSDGPMTRVARTEPHLSIIFEGNIFCSSGTQMYILNWPQVSRKTIAMHRNLYFDYTKDEPAVYDFEGVKLNLAELQERGFEHDSITADPLFRDPMNGDFTLAENSPAIKMGFKPIDISDVGAKR